jgi:hypothetical protein
LARLTITKLELINVTYLSIIETELLGLQNMKFLARMGNTKWGESVCSNGAH